MAVISSLVVKLSGNTAGLDTALDKSGKKVSAFGTSGDKANKKFASSLSALPGPVGKASSSLSSMGGMLSGLTGGLGLAGGAFVAFGAVVIAAAAALAAFGISRMSTIASTQRMAEELGIGYNALVALQHAAEMTGSSAEGMDTALIHFASHMGATGQEAVETNKHLSKLGMTLNDLQGMSLDQQFAKTADALKGMDNAQQRVNVSRELFGREGAQIINSLKGGSAALQGFRKDADQLGLTMDKEGIQKVQESSAAWKRFKAATEGVGNSLAVGLAPIVEWIGKKLTTLTEFANGAGDEWDKFGHRLLWVWDAVLLGLTRFVVSVGFAFTDTIPAIFDAFGTFASTFFENLWANIKNGWDALWNDKDFQWKGLADGWDAALKKMDGKGFAPFTDFEKNLMKDMEMQEGILRQLKRGPRQPDDGFKPNAGGDGTIQKGVAFAEQGSQEAFKILAGQQGDKMYALQNQQLKELREHNKQLNKLLDAWAKAQPVAAAKLGR